MNKIKEVINKKGIRQKLQYGKFLCTKQKTTKIGSALQNYGNTSSKRKRLIGR